ncbi:MAG: hypothetical protein KAG61_04285, partial [Bacteriovoracaceae bacterium]|nr:hypothetical protein [Bacteriovoracaceae bacterium]
MKILILECDENLRQLYSTVFENLGSNIAVTEAENAEEAIKFCTCDSYDVILSCYELKPTCSSDEFLAFYQQQDLNIPLVLITSISTEEIGMNGIEDSENIFHFLMPVELDDIVDKVGSLVYNRKFSETTIDSNFVKVKSAYFIPYGRTLTDIFLRLSSSKLIKILSAGSLYSIDDIEKYLVRGVRHFYVGRSEFDRYDAKEGDCAFLERVITPSETSEFDQWSKGHKALKFLIEEFGISQNTINVASEVTSATIHKILENKEQASYFDIKNKKGKDFIFDHSYVVSIIGCGILKHLKTASKHELENLCYMSLFHDISHNRDQLARINGISDKKFQELDFKGKKEYLDSVNLSVKLI